MLFVSGFDCMLTWQSYIEDTSLWTEMYKHDLRSAVENVSQSK